MPQSFPRFAAILTAAGLAACAPSTKGPAAAGVAPATGHHSTTAVAAARADTGRFAYTKADVGFMTGMIAHHAQAVLMAGWAPSHGASPSVRGLCERIVVGQHDEIVLMQRWLRDRHEEVPEGDASHDMMPDMPGMDHMLMPGMLSAEQLIELDQTRGPDFDRLFLKYMIMHHNGAITMVNQLFGSQGAGEEEMVYRFASDVYADQTTEIDRMQKMLITLASEGRSQ